MNKNRLIIATLCSILWIAFPCAANAEIVVEILNTDGYVFSKEERATIEEIAVAAEVEIRSLLPQLPKKILLTVLSGKDVIPETGEMGTAVALAYVRWTVDPSRPGGVMALAKSNLRAALFHELNHLVRGWVVYGRSPDKSFMDGVVNEGLATAFERDAAGTLPPWGMYPEEVKDWVDELLTLPLSASYEHWMFRHPDGRRWIGYRAGTYIIDKAMEASGLSASELVQSPTAKILELAGFK
ncbi:MAG: DUF2268 domain-containing putative Zn-dependent protease [Candidatus Eisenbacteria bacterium]